MEAWLRGLGCVPIHNLMEDAATAEISRWGRAHGCWSQENRCRHDQVRGARALHKGPMFVRAPALQSHTMWPAALDSHLLLGTRLPGCLLWRPQEPAVAVGAPWRAYSRGQGGDCGLGGAAAGAGGERGRVALGHPAVRGMSLNRPPMRHRTCSAVFGTRTPICTPSCPQLAAKRAQLGPERYAKSKFDLAAKLIATTIQVGSAVYSSLHQVCHPYVLHAPA